MAKLNKFMWDLKWTNWDWDTFFFQYLGLFLPESFPPLYYSFCKSVTVLLYDVSDRQLC